MLALSSRVCYTSIGLRNAAKGGAPWRHAQNTDDKNRIAREPVFQAERVPGRADRTLLFQSRAISICVKVIVRHMQMHMPFFFCAEN